MQRGIEYFHLLYLVTGLMFVKKEEIINEQLILQEIH